MKNILRLVLITWLLSGCARDPDITEVKMGTLLPTSPVDQDRQSDLAGEDKMAFEDISLSGQRRSQILTNKMEIEKETDNYIHNGQADIITRPDGTILYPYGLAYARLLTKKMMYSKIILEEGEKIVSAAAGDTIRWNILPNYIGNTASYTPVVLVKPFSGGLQTNLSIITDRRDYDINIQSVDSGEYMSRIGFYYPQDKADSVRVGSPPDEIGSNGHEQPYIDVDNIKYDYRIQADRRISWCPVSVFEDGRKVFIRMPDSVAHSQLPVFMVIGPGGQAEVANYRYLKPYFIIDTLFERGMLVLGTDHLRRIITLIRK